MTFSVSVKHKKDKKIFLHIELTYFYQGNKSRLHILSVVCCTIKHEASAEGDWKKYLHFQQNTCLTFSAMARTAELNYNRNKLSSLKYVRT